jgi:phosphoribosylformylglycinamidine cyclo-ligase
VQADPEPVSRTLGDAATEAALAAAPNETMATLGEILLTPTRIYAPAILGARAAVRAAGLDLHGITHITGGGLPGNAPRAVGADLATRLDPERWAMPSVMRLFGALGGLDDEEIRATFNGGLGMLLVLPPAAIEVATAALRERGLAPVVVGEVVEAARVGGVRYVEGALESGR